MSLGTAEPGAEKAFRAVPCDRDSGGPASEAEYVHIIVLYTLASRKIIMAERRSHVDNFVSRHRRAHSTAAHQNTARYISTRHSPRQRNCEIGIVIVAVVDPVAKVDDLVAICCH
jgi:hypothetical protein